AEPRGAHPSKKNCCSAAHDNGASQMARCVHRDAASRNLMALWLAKDLVYPDQKISSRDLLSWNRAISKLCALPEEQLASFCQTFLHAVEDHAHPGVRHEIEKAIKEEPKARS